MLNIVYATVFHWDGSSTDLEQVMAFPFAEPNMNVAKLPAGSESIDVSSAQEALYHKLTVELQALASPALQALAWAATRASSTWAGPQAVSSRPSVSPTRLLTSSGVLGMGCARSGSLYAPVATSEERRGAPGGAGVQHKNTGLFQ